MSKTTNGYYVFMYGYGEYNHDWAVAFYPAASPKAALERAMDSSQGYGRDNSPAIVVHEDDAHAFLMVESRGFIAQEGVARTEILK